MAVKKSFIFKSLTLYSQKYNSISEQTGRILKGMMRITILEKNINDNLWPEIIFTIIQVKNGRSTYVLKGINSLQALLSKPIDINHLCILGSTMYVFIYKEERNLKSKIFEA